ncbi:MAG: hypothetical protein Q7T05_07365 [Dehalococcoidia bacterium]|nr:hypothetical protein [Dehalococcoidia bacterium]
MEQTTVILIVGGAFIIFGAILFLWDRRENLAYRDKLISRHDMREFMTAWPPRWWLKTLQLGGIISLIVGVGLLILGLVLRLKGG